MKFPSHAWLALLTPALFFATGCLHRLDIARDTRLQGNLRVSELVVSPGVHVTVASDLAIDSSGPVTIFGSLEAAHDSGADIRIRSRTGDIELHGSITSGDGADGGDVRQQGIAIGKNGADGGDIELSATGGSVVVRGALTAGNGGAGGGAQASGPGGAQYAESGRAGHGGDIFINAARGIDAGLGSAALDAGRGGTTGEASAEIVHLEPPVGNQPPAGEIQPPPPPQGTTTARTLAGGRGGRVVLTTSQANGRVFTQVRARGGAGGDSGRASASGGQHASANAGPGGPGGNIEMSARNGAIFTLTFPDPGNGGASGTPAAPPHASASGDTSALAEVGQGGAAGLWLEDGVQFGSGDGGGNGHARAQAAGTSKTSPGQTVLGSTPALSHRAKAP